MDKLILQCGRYYPPVQSGDTERLGRLENYVVVSSAEVESLFEICDRLRLEIARHLSELDEKVAALSAATSDAAVLTAFAPDEATANGDQNAPTSDA